MLLNRSTLEAITRGTVTLAFRRWRRPTVRAGGTLLTVVGQLAIDAVDVVEVDMITEADAQAAGHSDLRALRATLGADESKSIYRVGLRLAGPDPRIALREEVPADPEEQATLRTRLKRMDSRSSTGPWTLTVLELLRAHPEVRAADLAHRMSWETPQFKARVRRLKGLGLTESLSVGYRLSRRGEWLLREGADAK